MSNSSNQQDKGERSPKMPQFNMNWIYLIIIITLGALFFTDGGQTIGKNVSRTVSYDNFKTYVDKGYA